ncbi:hypothetical protein T4C_917 [Trichinella pseudospiralis]|uniref:Uncharacterized protein n=1 Tax=Trichinella pseudospiralis TaxID=6337 RepID=A0A0V1JLL9_TRIPS|nr:hypothetical protein T4C_917 [Trichinella pseudospiralis]
MTYSYSVEGVNSRTAMRFRSPTVIDEHLENGPE